jgi:hypothetical protein
MSGRDAFGNLLDLPGEPGSGRCVVSFCKDEPHHRRSSMINDYMLCDGHVVDWDEGRVRGSLVRGYTVVPEPVPTGLA